MLWEVDDPGRVLRERFGFGDGVSVGQWVTDMLRTFWGVEVSTCERVVMSDRNALAWVTAPSGRLLAKWSVLPERFAGLAQMARLTRWLDDRGMPVSAPIRALDGALQVEVDAASMSLQREVKGHLLDTAVPAEVHAAGAALARLHQALAAYPEPHGLMVGPAPALPLGERIGAWLDSRAGHVPDAARRVLGELIVSAPTDELPVQLVHGDFRSANVLCAAGEVVAVIDFEEARLDHRVVEVARSAVLLGTRFHDWAPVPPDVHATFLAGYRSTARLNPVEERWLDVLLLWNGLAMVPPGPDPTGWAEAARDHVDRLASGA